MNYGEVKDYFSKVLNRRDITPSLTGIFINNAIQRTQRLLRLPPMEKSVIVSPTNGAVDVPGDLLQFIAVIVDDKVHGRISLSDLLNYRSIQSSFNGYAIQDGQVLLTPEPPASADVRIDYYGDFTSLVADTDSNWMTEIAPDLIVYGALSYACDYFLDNRKQLFEERFINTVGELAEQRMMDELSAGAQIQPAYSMNY